MRSALCRLLSKRFSFLQSYSCHDINTIASLTRFQQSAFQSQCRSLGMLKQSTITDLSQEIDIESMKSKKRNLMRQGIKVNIHKMLEEALETKCIHFLDAMRNDPEQSKLLKIVQLEHSHLSAEGYAVLPYDNMTSKHWVETLTCSSPEERLTYFLFIGHKNKKKAEDRCMERKKKEDWEQRGMKEGESNHSIIYADGEKPQNSRWGNHRLSSSMKFGLPLVVDMDYADNMTSKEIGQTAKQLWMAYCTNRAHANPFHLVMTGCPSTNSVYRTLQLRHLLDCDHFLATTTEESYLDLFNPSDIVYLSPHAKQPMRKFDPSKTYVLAAYSDMLSQKRMALAKAKQQKIVCQRLPIDENIKWVQGNKDLFLNAVLQVLLGAKEQKMWKEAFSSALPARHYKYS